VPLKSKIKFQDFSRTSRSSRIPEWADRSHSTLELVKSGKPLHTTTQGTLCPSLRGWHWIQNLKVKVKDVSFNLSILNFSVLLSPSLKEYSPSNERATATQDWSWLKAENHFTQLCKAHCVLQRGGDIEFKMKRERKRFVSWFLYSHFFCSALANSDK